MSAGSNRLPFRYGISRARFPDCRPAVRVKNPSSIMGDYFAFKAAVSCGIPALPAAFIAHRTPVEGQQNWRGGGCVTILDTVMDETVRIEGLVKRFGSLTRVDGISFDVKRGEIVSNLGPHGAAGGPRAPATALVATRFFRLN